MGSTGIYRNTISITQASKFAECTTETRGGVREPSGARGQAPHPYGAGTSTAWYGHLRAGRMRPDANDTARLQKPCLPPLAHECQECAPI